MHIQNRPEIAPLQMIAPILIAIIFIIFCSLLREPTRRDFSAIVIAGAGAAYLNGGFGATEFAFCTVMTFVAYRGLSSYRWIGAGWMLHTAWDIAHHFYGNPIVPFATLSSFGCAICDPVLAIWYFAKAPSPWPHARVQVSQTEQT